MKTIVAEIVQTLRFQQSFDRYVLVSTWVLFAYGVIVRLAQYLSPRSYYMDELFLLDNLQSKSYLELWTEPLSQYQRAPYGFLVMQKWMLGTFGDGEYVMRFFPFLFGIIALILVFYFVRQIRFGTAAKLLLLFLFASSWPTIYYSADLKPYSLDLMITLILILVALRCVSDSNTMWWWVLALLGIIAPLLSLPTVFILAGIGVGLLLENLRNPHLKDKKRKIIQLGLLGASWIVSFTIYYLAFVKSSAASDLLLVEFWRDVAYAFPPLDGLLMGGIKLLQSAFISPVGVVAGISDLMLFLTFIGVFVVFSRDRFLASVLTMPILFCLVAAALEVYPFHERTILFLICNFLILSMIGFNWLYKRISFDRIGQIVVVTLICFLVSTPTRWAFQTIVREDVKPALTTIQQKWQPGDLMYVYAEAQFGAKYYLEKMNAYNDSIIIGNLYHFYWLNYDKEISQFQGKSRVWLFFTHTSVNRYWGVDDRQLILQFARSRGEVVERFSYDDVYAYLFDFSPEAYQRAQAKIHNDFENPKDFFEYWDRPTSNQTYDYDDLMD